MATRGRSVVLWPTPQFPQWVFLHLITFILPFNSCFLHNNSRQSAYATYMSSSIDIRHQQGRASHHITSTYQRTTWTTAGGRSSKRCSDNGVNASVCLPHTHIFMYVCSYVVALSLMLCPQSEFIVPECGGQSHQLATLAELALITQLAKRWEPWACCCCCGILQLHKLAASFNAIYFCFYFHGFVLCLLHVCFGICVFGFVGLHVNSKTTTTLLEREKKKHIGNNEYNQLDNSNENVEGNKKRSNSG